MVLNINQALIKRATEKALKDSVLGLSAYITTEVISSNRPWPEPLGTRDIVDDGGLRSSQRVNEVSPEEYQIAWTVEYALFVHEGYTLPNGTRIPGRPFAQIGLDEFDVEDAFAKSFRRTIGD